MEGKSYRLRYLKLFEEDLNEIIDYIVYKLENQEAARNLIDVIDTAITTRLVNPESFEPYQSVIDRKYHYYRIYVKNFVIYYVVIDDEADDYKIMEVRRILYNKRDKRILI